MRNSKATTIILIVIIIVPVILYFYAAQYHLPIPGITNNEAGKVIEKTDQPIKLNEEKEKLLEDLVTHRKPLVEESDQKAKAELIKHPNPLLTTNDYIVTYDKKDDFFQAEIKTIKISTARDEVVAWFRSKGFSGAAVCILPIQFTIDEQSAESLRGLGIIFNPLPPGC